MAYLARHGKRKHKLWEDEEDEGMPVSKMAKHRRHGQGKAIGYWKPGSDSAYKRPLNEELALEQKMPRKAARIRRPKERVSREDVELLQSIADVETASEPEDVRMGSAEREEVIEEILEEMREEVAARQERNVPITPRPSILPMPKRPPELRPMTQFTPKAIPQFGAQPEVRPFYPDFIPSRQFGRVELKEAQCAFSFGVIGDLANGTLISGNAVGASPFNVAQGATKSTRVGNRMTVRSLCVKVVWYRPATLTTTTTATGVEVVRCAIVLDTQSSAATAAPWSTVFDTTSGAPPTEQYPVSENSSRFKILYDQKITLGKTGQVYWDGTVAKYYSPGDTRIDKYYRVFDDGIEVSFKDDTGTFDSITTNGLSIYAAENSPNFTPAGAPQCHVSCQVRYTDM